MIKMIIGLLAGMILAGALFMGPLSITPTTAQAGEPSLAGVPADIAETYHEALTSPLQEAGNEIQDKDTARFYRKLIREYNLDEASSGVAQAEHSGLAGMLPDIKNINRKALNLPLQEAGKNIQDEEIAQFYYKLLKDAGWEIEPD